MLNKKDSETIIDTCEELIVQERNAFNEEITQLKDEVLRQKETNKCLQREKMTTSSFRVSSLEHDSYKLQQQQQPEPQQQPQQGKASIQLPS